MKSPHNGIVMEFRVNVGDSVLEEDVVAIT
ncbi:MAG: hypothetical protein E3J42_04615 [Dehalococcoidia bacterium]|nr:MAG: hypothetical protein E3J42_04615 [Dehalococcoidia bacterium]